MMKKPVPMTITEAFRSLAQVLTKKTPEERERFKEVAPRLVEI